MFQCCNHPLFYSNTLSNAPTTSQIPSYPSIFHFQSPSPSHTTLHSKQLPDPTPTPNQQAPHPQITAKTPLPITLTCSSLIRKVTSRSHSPSEHDLLHCSSAPAVKQTARPSVCLDCFTSAIHLLPHRLPALALVCRSLVGVGASHTDRSMRGPQPSLPHPSHL